MKFLKRRKAATVRDLTERFVSQGPSFDALLGYADRLEGVKVSRLEDVRKLIAEVEKTPEGRVKQARLNSLRVLEARLGRDAEDAES